jgi:hypothetical protein
VLCDQCGTNIPDGLHLCSKCESDLEPALVHESGHALMAVLQGVMCRGICFDRDEEKFCTLGPPPRPFEQWSREDYLFSAAGVAAEKVIYGRDHDSGGAGGDRKDFESLNAPPFELTVSEAYEILSGEDMRLKRLTSRLMARVKGLGFNFSSLPTAEANGKQLPVLLNSEELGGSV